MKKLLCLILVVLIFCIFPNVQAEECRDRTETVIHLENGEYIVVEIVQKTSRAIYSQSGSKSYTFYGSDNAAKWQAVLNGTYIYTGSSSTCTAASCDVTIFDGNYYLISKNASRSGNAAYGTVTVDHKILGVTVTQNSINLTLTCDVNGNLS